MNADEAFAIRTLALRVAELAAEVERLDPTKRCDPCRRGHHDTCTGDCESICCALAAAAAEAEAEAEVGRLVAEVEELRARLQDLTHVVADPGCEGGVDDG